LQDTDDPEADESTYQDTDDQGTEESTYQDTDNQGTGTVVTGVDYYEDADEFASVGFDVIPIRVADITYRITDIAPNRVSDGGANSFIDKRDDSHPPARPCTCGSIQDKRVGQRPNCH
jgi:hypothetical protein